jgi:hypothetical protein
MVGATATMTPAKSGLAAVLERIEALSAELAETTDRQVGVQISLERTRRELAYARAAAAEASASVGRSWRARRARKSIVPPPDRPPRPRPPSGSRTIR